MESAGGHTHVTMPSESKPQSAPFRLTEAFLEFARSEQFAGVLLIACTILSLVLANSPLSAVYLGAWQWHLGPLSVEHWINDALMAIFFLLIGLELEREIYVGELSTLRSSMLPAVAAAGGMAAPALIHYSFNTGTPTEAGFGIPMATDIAFALGILALLGKRVPAALKVFVVAFAVIDDLGAIVLIALVYTEDISKGYLFAAVGIWAALLALNRPLRIMAIWPYLLGGVAMWYCLLHAGIHASIAGVMLAFAIPFTPRDSSATSPSQRLMHVLHKPVAFVILPLFALANTAITLDAGSLPALISTNSLGIALGLIVGKPLGVLALSAAAVSAGICSLPSGVRWRQLAGAGMIGGIGFTMSIFITNLAFAGEVAVINSSKLAVLVASLIAGALGYLWLRSAPAGDEHLR
jgi:NhaA family Na+:H+ antiporter